MGALKPIHAKERLERVSEPQSGAVPPMRNNWSGVVGHRSVDQFGRDQKRNQTVRRQTADKWR